MRPSPVAAMVLIVGVSMVAACQSAASAQPPQMAGGRPPYRIGAMTVTNGSISLAATVTVPEGPGPFPAVVVTRGAGAADQDLAVADVLTRRGIVVLRADARGVGLSTGDAVPTGPDTFADDIVAMVRQLLTIPSVDPDRIGVVGRGQGAALAARAAARSPLIRFVAAFSGTAEADTALKRLAVPVFTSMGDPDRADVAPALATWILAHKK